LPKLFWTLLLSYVKVFVFLMWFYKKKFWRLGFFFRNLFVVVELEYVATDTTKWRKRSPANQNPKKGETQSFLLGNIWIFLYKPKSIFYSQVFA
jgi:hypothetical protein